MILAVSSFESGLAFVEPGDRTFNLAEINALSVEGVPADIGEHGAADDKSGDDESGQDTGPKAHPAEWDEEDAVFAREVDARLIG